MKYGRRFLVLTLAAIFSLLAVVIPTSPALAAESITVSPEEGDIGDSVKVRGDGFSRSTDTTTYRVDIYFTSENGDINDIDYLKNYEKWTTSIDGYGEFSKTITIPSVLSDGEKDEAVHGGTYYFYVTYKDEDAVEDFVEFTVIAGVIEIDPNKGPVGTEVDISGSYFKDRENITVTFDGDEIDIESGDTGTDRHGEFVCTILIPEGAAGEHTIAVEDESDHIAEATFTVEPAITISPTSASMGKRATVSGAGFGASVEVTITLAGDRVASGKTGSDGSFEVAFTVPNIDSGSYEVEAEDKDGNSATAAFTVAAGITLSPTTSAASPGYVGMEMTMSGTGFIPNAPVTITYATEPVVIATTTTDANGDFSATFTIPSSTAGEHTITATDGSHILSSTVIIEASPPEIPQPLLPEMGVKAARPVHFDWEDVTDPSGVTYTLQIATDDDFSNIVLEKTGLTTSEYTLTKEEKLPSTKKESPYRWRVKAIDGAFNESGWTGAGTFYVGFAWPSWSIHLWWGIGAAGAGALGYYIGRRRSYYY